MYFCIDPAENICHRQSGFLSYIYEIGESFGLLRNLSCECGSNDKKNERIKSALLSSVNFDPVIANWHFHLLAGPLRNNVRNDQIRVLHWHMAIHAVFHDLLAKFRIFAATLRFMAAKATIRIHCGVALRCVNVMAEAASYFR